MPRTRIRLTTTLLLALALVTGACSQDPATPADGPETSDRTSGIRRVARVLSIQKPEYKPFGDPLEVRPGHIGMFRVPADSDPHDLFLLSHRDAAQARAIVHNTKEDGPAETTDISAVDLLLELVDGWGYFVSHGWQPRARGRRIAPVGSGTAFILWRDGNGTSTPADDIDVLIMVKRDASEIPDDDRDDGKTGTPKRTPVVIPDDGTSVAVWLLPAKYTTGDSLEGPPDATLTKHGEYVRVAHDTTAITVQGPGGNDEVTALLAEVEQASRAAGLRWPPRMLPTRDAAAKPPKDDSQ